MLDPDAVETVGRSLQPKPVFDQVRSAVTIDVADGETAMSWRGLRHQHPRPRVGGSLQIIICEAEVLPGDDIDPTVSVQISHDKVV